MFIRRTSAGSAILTVKDVKLGRNTSTIHVSLSQDGGREEVIGYITLRNLTTESGVSLDTSWHLFPPPYSADTALLREDKDPNWKLQPEMAFAAFRKASAHLDFYLPRKGQKEKSHADEWICFSDGEKFTASTLGYVADAWPQLVDAYRENNKDIANAKLWYPTLLLNLEIKKGLGPEGQEWLFVRVRLKRIKNGRLDLEVIILDEEGDIVALSNHVNFVLGAERNIARWQKGGKL